MALRTLGKTKLELAATLLYVCSGLLGGYFITSQFGSKGAATWVVVNTILLALTLSVLSARCSDNKIDILAVYPRAELMISLTSLFGLAVVNEVFDRHNLNIYLTVIVNMAILLILWGVAIRYYLNEKTT